MIPTPDDPWAQQSQFEFRQWLKLISGTGSLLEIGSCFGSSLAMMADVLAPGARVVSVDLGQGLGRLEGVDTSPPLKLRLEELRRRGFDTHLILGNSHDQAIVEQAKALGPFDVIFIDGDHEYDGAKQDWKAYGPLGRIVGFHDTRYTYNCGVPQLWEEIKASGARYVEIVGSPWIQRDRFGIGVVFNDTPG